MLKKLLNVCVVIVIAGLSACTDEAEKKVTGQGADIQAVSIIPLPADVETGEGFLELSGELIFLITEGHDGEEGLRRAGAASARFVDQFSEKIPFSIGLASGEQRTVISMRTVDGMDQEGYVLEVNEIGILVRASTEAGHYYGLVSLFNLLSTNKMHAGDYRIPFVTITDSPRFGWRGLMLDEARHFRGKAFVKKLLDQMAAHKLNLFHWHLTDDQGWRIEITKYPRLTEFGAWRVPAGAASLADIDPATGEPRKIGGFYTQDDIREIVAYAAERNIEIVPEIDMPGHAQAAIMSYPELGTSDVVPGPVSADWGIFDYSYNLEEGTFQFLEGVLAEVIELFPGQYIHIGGDEIQTRRWEADPRIQERMTELGIKDEHHIQSYVNKRISNFLAQHNRRMIGWDEILEGEIAEGATVMSWRGETGGIKAAGMGHDVIMSPHPILYLDFLQGAGKQEPTGRPVIQPLESVYNYDPLPVELEPGSEKFILGAQANIWTEHMRTAERVEHMAFPRIAAVAEFTWSRKQDRDFGSFLDRLPDQLARYQLADINSATSAFDPEVRVTADADSYTVSAANQTGYGDIRYSTDGAAPEAGSQTLEGERSFTAGTLLRLATFAGDQRISGIIDAPLDRAGQFARTDEELELCTAYIGLRLDDDYPAGQNAVREILTMDIKDPCWIYSDADLTSIDRLHVDVGQVPFNFQIGADIDKMVIRESADPVGELQLFANTCEGQPASTASLAPAAGNNGITRLSIEVPAELRRQGDICLTFGRKTLEPLWGVNLVALPGQRPSGQD